MQSVVIAYLLVLEFCMAISERIQENPLYLLFEFQVSDFVVFGLLQREIYLKVIIENWHFLPIF